jgi:2-methylcitrate dehydratase PrpD
VLHPLIDASLSFVREHKVKAEDVEAVSLRVNYLVQEVTGKRRPRVGIDGKFSWSHCVAVSFIDGHVGEGQFSDARVLDSEVVALSDRVQAVVDPSMPADAVHMELTLRDGRKIMKDIEHALGSLKNPLSDALLTDKFRRLCDGILEPTEIERLIEQCLRLVELHDVGEIARGSLVA